ncbi:MAG: recombinase XerD [Bacteroidetes bacterium GWF2_42_66]|nr:MAG: recombinase XerD [Bacteroidetes bacterium GWA2_42_15]OFX98103.1 MAG: recombinase XerD [Bacteroidetes bacterium GWE2_42_39]OFY42487.1 MAG: recombinase XerD [Bacteroidetes bacterium GWF2_42_66]
MQEKYLHTSQIPNKISMFRASTVVILDQRFQKKDKTYAVKLRVTYNREQKYYLLGKDLDIDQWSLLQERNPKDKEIKRLKLLFAEIEKKAIKIIDDMEIFSFQEFEKKFNQKPKSSTDVMDALHTKMETLKAEGRLNSAESYKSTYKSFTSFLTSLNRKKLKYADITPEYLEEYEAWMKANGSSITTIGIYLRNLRTIFNQAIEEGIFQHEFYPFGKRKYQIPAGQNIKKALRIDDIKKIVDYKPETQAEAKAKDLWLFSYLCNGVNVKDIVRLQYRNLSKKHITFIRAKTERSTKSNQKEIVIVRMPEIDEIINKWGIKPEQPNKYIFDLISENDTPVQELAKIKQATKTINKYMKRIGEKLELDLKLTTYTARHSFATTVNYYFNQQIIS